MNSKLIIVLVAVLSYLSSSQAWSSEAAAKSPDSETSNQMAAQKRQLVPMPRIGRSLLSYAKRQSGMLPSPRIGRSDPSMNSNKAPKSANAVDCTANPEMCENTGSSGGGFGGSNGNNEDLVEPIDIQLRAAFIPRLGKRRVAFNEGALEDGRSSGFEGTSEGKQQLSRKWVLIPGLGYIDAEAAGGNYGDVSEASEDEQNELLQQQRNALIRSLVESSALKRAMPYTPRIGRAVFAPRIGKKATFVPRIG